MKIKYVLFMFGLACLTSCFKDDTTDGTGAISEIVIEEGSVKEVYNINRNETLTIRPAIKQTNGDKPLGYTWEIEQKVFSNAPELVYTGDMLGSYKCRLIVENEDGKTFFPFTLHVNSPYEEGITVLSCDKEGKSMLSFMLKQRDGSTEDHFEDGDCFKLNNPDEHFASHVTDMVQCDGSLIISCKGDGTSNDPGTIYYLNEKTFVVENMFSTMEYPDFKPTHMAIPANGSAGVGYPILSENGKVYEFSTTEGVLTPASRLKYNYAQSCAVHSGGSAGKYSLYFWDTDINALSIVLNGYGPYYCSSTYLQTRDKCVGSENYFDGVELVTMFLPRVVGSEKPTLVVVTKKGTQYRKVILYANFWQWSEELGRSVLVDNGGQKLAGFSSNLTGSSPLVASRLYYALLYGEGNKVYRWNYSSSQMLNKVSVVATVGTEQAVITGMELSEDQKETFVAFYEPGEEGLNGHIWVFATDEGTLLRKYDNVCYRPVKIMYKKK